MITRRSLINFGWLSVVNLMWATQFPAYQIASEYMSPSLMSCATFACAVALLLPFMGWGRERTSDQKPASESRGPLHSIGSFALLACLGILPPSLMMSWGIAHSTASNAALLTLTQPVTMLLLAVPLLGEKLTRTRLLAVAVALAGTICISRNDLQGGSFSSATLAGNLVIFAACAGGSFYNIYSKRLLGRFSELAVLTWGYLFAGCICGAIFLLSDPGPLSSIARVPGRGWWAVLALATLTWGLSMVLFMWLLKRVDIAQVSISIYLLSFFGVILSALTLHEHPQLVQLLGGAIVIAATLLADASDARQAQSAAKSA